jgi:hypothetical protein
MDLFNLAARSGIQMRTERFNRLLRKWAFVEITDIELRTLRCLYCDACFRSTDSREGDPEHARCYWECPRGCNRRAHQDYPHRVADGEADPPWSLPERPAETAAPAIAPRGSKRVRLAEYTAIDVVRAVTALMRDNVAHQQPNVDYFLRRQRPPNRRNVYLALRRAGMTWSQALELAREQLAQDRLVHQEATRSQ